MSPAIDERVVQMEFDNSRFEKNVSTSISTLDKLKSALKLNGATDGLSSIEKQASSGLNLGGISSAVETISGRFSALGVISTRILQNIGDEVYKLGARIKGYVDQLTFDQVGAGWDKYAEKTTSVQTIMAATEKTWEKSAADIGFVGSQMDFVNSQMDKLNWFTDETSYSFTDMVSNIGKFTANNIPLETSVTAMQGIANWAAISGQNAGAASRAMYNLAQAIGVGSVKLMDWKSIENANMATAGFKERVLEVAAANGQLKTEVDKAGKTIYKTVKGTEVSVESFSQTLSEGWFDKNTLLSVLDDYGSFTNQLYEFSQTTGLTATDILELVDAQEEGTLSTEALAKAAKEAGMSAEEFEKNLQSLGSEENKFGRQAFKAAQEAKTFQDAIDATKDAASTKWMNIFENIFGDYEKARHVWTDFANFLYDIFVAPLETLEELSEYFSDWDGLDMIRNSFGDIKNFLIGDAEKGIVGALGSMKDGFQEILPPLEITSADVGRALYKFRNFAASLKLSEEQAERFKSAGQGLANILSFIGNSIKNVWDATAGLRSALGNLAGAVGNLVLGIFGMASDMDNSGVKVEGFRKICDKLGEIINFVANAIRNLNLDALKEKFQGLGGILKAISSVFTWVADKITSFNFSGAFGAAVEWVKAKFEQLKSYLSQFDWSKIFKGAAGTGILALLGTKLVGAIKNIREPFKFLEDIKEKFTKFPDAIGKIFSGISDALGAFSKSVKADAFKSIATGILLLAGALLILGLVNYENAVTGVMAIAAILAGMMVVFKSLESVNKTTLITVAGAMLAAAAAMLVLAVALAVLAGAVALFTLVAKMDGVTNGLLLMAGALAVAVAALYAMSKMSPKVIIAAAAMLIFAASLLILAAAVAAFAKVAQMEGVWTGLAVMAASLLILVASLIVLSQVALGALAGAAALLVVSAALLVLAGALWAFSAIAGMETFGAGLGALAVMILVLTAALVGLGLVGPMVLVGAAALLVAAAACVVLAIAVAAVSAVLPLLGAGLSALGSGIGSAVSSIGEGVGEFLTGVASGIEAAGAALGQMVADIGNGIGAAVAGLGTGVGEAITAIVASVGNGIGQGIQSISDAVGSFGENLAQAGQGITELGNSVRSLDGISWASTAIGIGELALALKKLNPEDLSASMGPAAQAVTTMCTEMVTAISTVVPQVTIMSQQLGQAIVTGLTSQINTVATTIRTALTSSVSIIGSFYGSFYGTGANLGAGLANGIQSQIARVASAAAAMVRSAISAAREAAKEGSPSKITTQSGIYFGMGYANGILSQRANVSAAADTMVKGSVKALNNARTLISRILEDDFTPVITPVIDTSKVSGALNGLSNTVVRASTVSSGVQEIQAARNYGISNGVSGNSTQNVTNLYLDGIKYNTDDYIDSSISGFVETMVRKQKMYA